MCALAWWSICNACKNLRGQHPQRPKYSLPKNVRLGGSIWAPITCLFVDQSSRIFSPNVERLVASSDLRYVGSVLEVFAIKVESFQKSRRILDIFFALSNFTGRAFQNLYPFYHPCLVAIEIYSGFTRVKICSNLLTMVRSIPTMGYDHERCRRTDGRLDETDDLPWQ